MSLPTTTPPPAASNSPGLFALPSVEAPSTPSPAGNTSTTSLPGETPGPKVPDSVPEGVEDAFDMLGQGGSDEIRFKLDKSGDTTKEPAEVKDQETPTDKPLKTEPAKTKIIQPPKEEVTPAEKPTKEKEVVSRDMSGVPEEYHKSLRNMSNEAFKTIKPIIQEREELKKKVQEKETELQDLQKRSGMPANYYEHPEALTITPQYKALINDFTSANEIESHFTQQLLNIREGKDWTDLYVGGDGKIYQTKPLKADAASDVKVSQRLGNVNQQKQQLQAEAVRMQTEFKQEHTRLQGFIQKDIIGKFFADLTDEQLAKPEMAEIKKSVEQFAQTIPPALRNSMWAPAMYRFGVRVVQQGAYIKQLTDQIEQLKLGAKDKQLTQPNAQSTAGGTTAAPARKDPDALWKSEFGE